MTPAARLRALSDAATPGEWVLARDTWSDEREMDSSLCSRERPWPGFAKVLPSDAAWIALTGSQRVREALCEWYAAFDTADDTRMRRAELGLDVALTTALAATTKAGR